MNPNDKDTNRDPISGEPGSHPVGTGVGAVGGGATGAAIGSVAGPIGTVAGAVIGAVAGKGVAELIDPTAENAYWRDNHKNETYADKSLGYDQYEPAYRTGYTGFGKHAGKKFDDVENDLQRDWEKTKGNSSLAWSDAKHATKAAWNKVERTVGGESR